MRPHETNVQISSKTHNYLHRRQQRLRPMTRQQVGTPK